MATIALGVHAVRVSPVRMPSLLAALGTGLVGFTIRQYAAVPLVAVALVGALLLWPEHERRRLRLYLGAVLTTIAAAAVFWAYWRTIPHPKAFAPEMPSGHSIRSTLYKGTGMVRLTGLLVAPALALAGPVQIVKRSWAAAKDTTVFVGLGVVGLLTFTATEGPNIAFAGNYITPNGILAQGVAPGERPDILPAGSFGVLLAIGTVAAGVLALTLVPLVHQLPERWRHRELTPRDPVVAFLGLVVAGYCAAHFLAGITDIVLYDRYVLPVVPVIAMLLLRTACPEPAAARIAPATVGRARLATAAAALAALGLVGFVYTVDSASFDGTRWRVATAATHDGWTRKQIRGGFEWTNYYAGRRVHKATRYCVQVLVNPKAGVDDPRVVAYSYYRSPFNDPVPVVARRTSRPCTPGR
jgi:hypothetical protein